MTGQIAAAIVILILSGIGAFALRFFLNGGWFRTMGRCVLVVIAACMALYIGTWFTGFGFPGMWLIFWSLAGGIVVWGIWYEVQDYHSKKKRERGNVIVGLLTLVLLVPFFFGLVMFLTSLGQNHGTTAPTTSAAASLNWAHYDKHANQAELACAKKAVNVDRAAVKSSTTLDAGTDFDLRIIVVAGKKISAAEAQARVTAQGVPGITKDTKVVFFQSIWVYTGGCKRYVANGAHSTGGSFVSISLGIPTFESNTLVMNPDAGILPSQWPWKVHTR